MASYLVLPSKAFNWSGREPEKVRVNEHRFGILDFLREIEEEPFPFHRGTPLCIEKLDEFLIESGHLEKPGEDRDWPLLHTIHQKLVAVANDVAGLGNIQVPITYDLVLGAGGRLYVQYTGKQVPLWRIFGQHPADFETTGCNGYSFAETLS